jgi:hypothetical protein
VKEKHEIPHQQLSGVQDHHQLAPSFVKTSLSLNKTNSLRRASLWEHIHTEKIGQKLLSQQIGRKCQETANLLAQKLGDERPEKSAIVMKFLTLEVALWEEPLHQMTLSKQLQQQELELE